MRACVACKCFPPAPWAAIASVACKVPPPTCQWPPTRMHTGFVHTLGRGSPLPAPACAAGSRAAAMLIICYCLPLDFSRHLVVHTLCLLCTTAFSGACSHQVSRRTLSSTRGGRAGMQAGVSGAMMGFGGRLPGSARCPLPALHCGSQHAGGLSLLT